MSNSRCFSSPMLWSVNNLIIWICFFPLQTLSSSKDRDTSTLQLLQVISRHGARTPYSSSYPNDPNVDFLALGKGQLTLKGTVQMYEFGQTIRKRYPTFFKNDYRTVLARSSTITRCIQSGAAMLSAIYPKPTLADLKKEEYAKGSSYVQTIPIYTSPPECNKGLLYPVMDFNYLELFDHVVSSDLPLLKKELEEVTSVKNITTSDLVMWSDALTSEEFHEVILPPWYPSFKYKLSQLTKLFTRKMSSHQMAGPLLKDILTNVENPRLTNDTDIEINSYFYFTHDVIVASLLGCLKVPLSGQPPFGATVLIEKHLTDKGEVVRFFYLDSPESEPKQLFLPDCEDTNGDCTIEELRDIVVENKF